MKTPYKKILIRAAADLANELKRSKLPLVYKKNTAPQWLEEFDCWWVTLADWRHRPSIGICIDHILDNKRPSLWAGFCAKRQRLVQLNNELSGDMRSHHILYDEAHAFQRPSARKLQFPIIEHDDESYLGIYSFVDTGRIGSFEIHRYARFIRNVVRTSAGLVDIEIDIVEIEEDATLSPTTKKQLIDARRGQGKYRRSLEKLWENRCAVSQCEIRQVLKASHIKPWSASDNTERRDPNNGLLLSASLDALFDSHLISFSDTGKMLISERICPKQRTLLNLPSNIPRPLNAAQKRYLADHRHRLKR